MAADALVLIGTGLFIGALGALIKYAGAMHLIAGYDPDRVSDEEGLADFVGTNALYVALLTVCVGVLSAVEPTADDRWYWIGYAVAVGAIAVRMVRGARRYESAPEN